MSNDDGSDEKVNISLYFSRRAADRLESIKDRAKEKNRAETIRNAIRLYDWWLEQQELGNKIVVTNGDEWKEVEICFKDLPKEE